ncbi:MAG: hypothetical protein M3Y17_12965 [Actinomycetota bacterium]|nr:hypothetical protein [Actinomycetota bacterium]
MRARRAKLLVTAAAAAMLAAGCGSGATTSPPANAGPRAVPAPGHGGSVTPPAGTPLPGPGSGSDPGSQAIPAPAPTGIPANPAGVRVIRGWSNALLRGNARGAAAYFALPSEFINSAGPDGGGPVIAIHTLHDAEAADATLSCGAEFVSADQRGRYINALFRLTQRPGLGAGCGSGVGQLARTNFVIVNGRITQWIRAPNDPGDGKREPQPPAQPAPSGPGGPPMV